VANKNVGDKRRKREYRPLAAQARGCDPDRVRPCGVRAMVVHDPELRMRLNL
jgi:hypothetical protein